MRPADAATDSHRASNSTSTLQGRRWKVLERPSVRASQNGRRSSSLAQAAILVTARVPRDRVVLKGIEGDDEGNASCACLPRAPEPSKCSFQFASLFCCLHALTFLQLIGIYDFGKCSLTEPKSSLLSLFSRLSCKHTFELDGIT